MRWLLWFLLVPQAFLAAEALPALGLPPVDVATAACLFLAFFADAAAIPGLLVGAAVGRALVDDAGLPVQVLVLGAPVAVLLPLRALVYGHRWLWLVAAAAVCALAIPRLSLLCGRWFQQPCGGAVDGVRVAAAALVLPPLLLLLRRLPPLRAFAEGGS